ncbi:zinc transporter ZupT [Candidatus Saccharibacteria bacterium]|nr:zinc transporter ZupT [Candidatus Saccharibacteria bacterium]
MLLAFTLTLIAGIATVLGGIIGVHSSIQKPGRLSIVLGFAAGVMVCVSFLDLLPTAYESLNNSIGVTKGMLLLIVALLAGALVVRTIDKFIPCSNVVKCPNTSITKCMSHDECVSDARRRRLLKSGMMISAIMAIHNFPEGIVTFTGAMHSTTLGVSLAAAIALHNIPEGIAIASPIYTATKKKLTAIKYAVLSGLTEPLGGLLGYLLLVRTMPESMLGVIFAATAGMMLYISFSEIIPAAHYYSFRKREPLLGASTGLGVMMASIIIMNVF